MSKSAGHKQSSRGGKQYYSIEDIIAKCNGGVIHLVRHKSSRTLEVMKVLNLKDFSEVDRQYALSEANYL